LLGAEEGLDAALAGGQSLRQASEREALDVSTDAMCIARLRPPQDELGYLLPESFRSRLHNGNRRLVFRDEDRTARKYVTVDKHGLWRR
jgi:hypothetical protein